MNVKIFAVTVAALLVALLIAGMVDRGRTKGGKDPIFSK